MTELDIDFDPNAVPEDDRSFDALPAGDYMMQATESEIKLTKNGTAQLNSGRPENQCDCQLILTLEVIDGPHQNRKVWDRINLRNENPEAQRIGHRQLADLCLAVNSTATLRTTEDLARELHFKPFTGRVTIQQDKSGQYGPQNRVRYKARGGQPPPGKAPARPLSAANAGNQSTGTGQASTQTERHVAAASRSNAAPAAGARPWKKAG